VIEPRQRELVDGFLLYRFCTHCAEAKNDLKSATCMSCQQSLV